MRFYRRLIFAVVLLAFSAGCSGYRTALVPGVYDPAMPADPDSPVVEVGMEVRVLLRSGEDQRGEVVQLGEQSLGAR